MHKGQLWTFWPAEAPKMEPPGLHYKGFPLFLFFLLALTALFNLTFINNELWQDELYTLDNFVLVPVSKTLTDYHSTNNHLIFSLLSNIYLKIAGISNLHTLMESPWIIRLLPYCITLLTIPCFYFLTRRIFGSLFSAIATLLLATSLETYSFGTLVRGYSLEILLSTLLLLWILRYQQTSDKRLLLPIALVSAAGLLNLPPAIYSEAALWTLLAVSLFSAPAGTPFRPAAPGIDSRYPDRLAVFPYPAATDHTQRNILQDR